MRSVQMIRIGFLVLTCLALLSGHCSAFCPRLPCVTHNYHPRRHVQRERAVQLRCDASSGTEATPVLLLTAVLGKDVEKCTRLLVWCD